MLGADTDARQETHLMPQLIDTGTITRSAASPEILTFPGDPGWDDARRAWNLAIDQRPAAVATPETVDDVVAAVDHARTVGLRVAVQGTGHGARHDLRDGTLLINTSRMTGVEIDADARVARVAAGTIWSDVVDAAVEHGLTALHGSAHDVGVVGYTLGGGVGWLARRHGLSSSSLLSAQVVTADGAIVRADGETNPELFWALKGGGGNFGVVTEVEIALFPVTEVFAGWLVWPMERADEILAAWGEWTRSAPEEVTSIGRLLQLPPIPEVPEPLRGRQVVVVEAAYLGDETSGRELLRPLLELEHELDTFGTVPARALTELHQDPPAPVPGVGDGMLLEAFDAAAAAAIVDAAAMDGTAPLVSVEIRHLDGALGRPDPNGGALSLMVAPYGLYAIGSPMGPVTPAAIDERLGELRAAAAPWLSRSTYFNFADRDVDVADLYPGRAAERLAAIRAQVDPDSLFRSRHTI
jgi:FAD/FMN-containing dehydrogenase